MKQVCIITPELSCSNFQESLFFYMKVLGFEIVYDRPESQFAMLERQGARIMLEQSEPDDRWRVGSLEKPYGRGINLQIQTETIDALYKHIEKARIALFMPMEEKWYRAADKYVGNKQFLIQDPDGYLLRFFENLGARDTPPL